MKKSPLDAVDKDETPLSLRLAPALRRRVERLLPLMQQDDEILAVANSVTLSTAYRLVIDEGIRHYERLYAKGCDVSKK